MRGAAPSIVCPRCEREAPPADTIGQFTTCLGCGMVFDAAPRERLVSVKKPERPEPTEPTKPPVSWSGPLRAWQIVVALVGIGVLAYIKTEYFPSEEDRRRQAEIDQIQAENRAQSAARLRELRAARVRMIEIAGPRCAPFAELLRRPWLCPTTDAYHQLERESDASYDTFMAGSNVDAACAGATARITIASKRLGCR